MASPVQIILNPENYEEARVTNGGGGRKDFFAHRDRVICPLLSGPISILELVTKEE